MKILVVGATGTVGRAAATALCTLCGPGDTVLLGTRNLQAAEELARSLAAPGRPALDAAVVRLPLERATVLDGVDVVLCCAGPAVEYSHDLAARCARRGIGYVDVGGDQQLVDALDPVAREGGGAVLVGAGVQPGLLGWTVARAVSDGAREVTVYCGGHQRFTTVGAADYLAAVRSDLDSPGRCWRDGQVQRAPELRAGQRTVLPQLFGRLASVRLRLDDECVAVASECGLACLTTYSIVDAPSTAAVLHAPAGEASVTDLVGAPVEGDPYFAVVAETEDTVWEFFCTDSYEATGRIAALTAHEVLAEAPGARWASVSGAARGWGDAVGVHRRVDLSTPAPLLTPGPPAGAGSEADDALVLSGTR